MESSSKKARVLGYPEATVNDIADLKTLIESSQKESLWRLLEEKKAECSLLASRLAQLENNSDRLRLKAASYSCVLQKLASLSGKQFNEGLIDIDDPDSLAGQLWNIIVGNQSASFDDRITRNLNFEARLSALQEELNTFKELLCQREAEILSVQKHKNRIELIAARASDSSSGGNVDGLPCLVSEDPARQAPLAPDKIIELEMAQSLAARRLEELQAMEGERLQLIHKLTLLQESIRRMPEELIREPRRAHDLLQEIGSLKLENSRLKRGILDLEEKFSSAIKKRDARIVDIESSMTNKRVDLNKAFDSIQAEASRMRRERDNMRELYEHANSQVLAASKTMSHFQAIIVKLQSKCDTYDAQADRLARILNKLGELSSSGDDKDLQDTIRSLKDNENELYQELETIGRSFDDLANQNQLLSKQLAERDEALSKLMSEKLRAEFSSVQARKDAEIAMQKAQAVEVSSIERIANAESLEAHLRKDITEIENRFLTKQVEDEKMQQALQDLKIENLKTRSQLEHLGSLRLEEGLAESMRQLEAIRTDKKRLEDELTIVRGRLKKYSGSRDASSDELEKELAMYKKLMKCNSCHTRDKNAIIAKCMHVFCRPCLDSRIETRQRKCPNCGESFGANDVRNIYL